MKVFGVARNSAARSGLVAIIAFLAAFGVSGHAQTARHTCDAVAVASTDGSQFMLGNRWIQVQGYAPSAKWGGLRITDCASRRFIDLPEAFSLTLKNGSVLSSSSMRSALPFVVRNLRPDAAASRYSDRLPGKEICTEFHDPSTSAEIEWCGIVRDGSNYFRQQIAIHTGAKRLPITNVRLLHFKDAEAHVVGSVKGSPVADGAMFFGFEHPLSLSQVQDGEVVASLPRTLPMQPRQSIVYSSVVGVAAAGQMRRDFLRYIERERAHPYRPSLQYNTWYDLGYTNRYNETGVLNRIRAFGTELTEKRGATVTSFVFDDGWDNPHSLWGFDSG
ncbi:MAG: enterotoxin, partial [Acidobacteriaceae bacterium]